MFRRMSAVAIASSVALLVLFPTMSAQADDTVPPSTPPSCQENCAPTAPKDPSMDNAPVTPKGDPGDDPYPSEFNHGSNDGSLPPKDPSQSVPVPQGVVPLPAGPGTFIEDPDSINISIEYYNSMLDDIEFAEQRSFLSSMIAIAAVIVVFALLIAGAVTRRRHADELADKQATPSYTLH